MSEISVKLGECFAAVFPQLPSEEIPNATPTVVEGWDSIATITLVSVIEEQFGIQIDPEDIEHFVSYQAVLDYLTAKQVNQD
jgi:acyl carrier protein